MEQVPPYTLVVPAYNEAGRIQRLLAQIEGAEGEFIFVCEGEDGTPEIVNRFARAHPGMNITCVHRQGRLGKGGAITEGMRRASGRLVGYVDADASTSFSQMVELFSLLGDADAVIGSRWVPGAVIERRQGLLR
ncbi:MAG: glycosyltransferase, partial [Methanolinea sp.]